MQPILYDAKAIIRGSSKFPNIHGTFWFRQTKNGVLITAKVRGLPTSNRICENKVFATHIHQKGNCSGTLEKPFENVGSHYNPNHCPHPEHAGDLEPLFENYGSAYYRFLTNRFTVKEILGRSVIIHEQPDDFTTQPSGNAGAMIACGMIQ